MLRTKVLEQAESDYLLARPESGMGYQILLVHLQTEEPVIAFALNAEVLIPPAELPEEHRNVLERFPLGSPEIRVQVLVAEKVMTLYRESGTLQIPLEELGILEHYLPVNPPPAVLTPSQPTIVQPTVEYEGFVRFSAYPNDKRITPDHGLTPATYTTTIRDSQMVPSGLAVVARYALPTPQPAIYVYTIVPPPGTEVDWDTVVPLFGQSGGGVQALFVNGAAPGSASNPYSIPAYTTPE